VGHVARMGQMRNAYKIMVDNTEGKRTLGKSSRRCEDNITMNRMGWTMGVLGVQFPAGAGNFSLHHRVQNSFGTHPASYRMGTRGSFRGGKAAGV
jgi:hypothetical protein